MTIPTVQTALFWWIVPGALLAAQYQQSQEAQPLSPWWAPPDSQTGPAALDFPSAVTHTPWCVWSEVKPKFKLECEVGFSGAGDGALWPTDWACCRWSSCNTGGGFKVSVKPVSRQVNCTEANHFSPWVQQPGVCFTCLLPQTVDEVSTPGPTSNKTARGKLEGSRLPSTSCRDRVMLQSASSL